jgi:hypothetical protein
VSTRSIRTSTAIAACDVCGRTLLRGERAEVYLSGGTRRSVCELCTSRALHGGWVREGTVPEYEDGGDRLDRRRSLLNRWRNRRDGAAETEPVVGETPPDEPPQPAPAPAWLEANGRNSGRAAGGRDPEPREPRTRAARDPEPREPRTRAPRRDKRRDQRNGKQPNREPRHVRAVPTSIEHKISSAVGLFNDSEHPRTVAGIARSLGLPEVSVHPSDSSASVVNIVVAWELCWYRYEVDLSDEVPSFRVVAQGYELHELDDTERQNNAVADERGRLELGV